MVVRDFDLSVAPVGPPIEVHLNRGDADFQLVFHLTTRSGTLKLESNTSAQIRGTKADGSTYQAAASVSVTDKTVTVNGDAAMTDVAGIAKFEICLIHARKELYTQNFKVCIEDI